MQNLWKTCTWIHRRESQLLWFVHISNSCQDFTAASAVGWAGHFTLWNSLCATYNDKFKCHHWHFYQKDQRTCFPRFHTLTQWSRACRKSNSSSVHSSSVWDLELTRASHSSRRSFVCTQCSDSSHFALIVSRGSCETRSKRRIFLKMVQFYQHECKMSLEKKTLEAEAHIRNAGVQSGFYILWFLIQILKVCTSFTFFML